jgi:hypothetical protein
MPPDKALGMKNMDSANEKPAPNRRLAERTPMRTAKLQLQLKICSPTPRDLCLLFCKHQEIPAPYS